ncbi:MAG TPA: type II secretion system protein GspG, partial [Kiritimatiellia bacterium]|nr:type II secretion system protein GspG [Kiritimatiellia bacterium]
PEQEPALVLELLQTFRRTTGHFPTAEDNPGLIRQLQHPRGTTPPLLPLHHPRIDHHGALLDPWGTPYFFHHLSRNRLEIRSAGPDREFHTDDDLLLPSQP